MLSRRPARHLAITAIGLLAVVSAAHTQSPLGIGSAEPSFSISGPFAPLMQWINAYQQMFYRALTGALKAMREDGWAFGSLIGLSFAYGVFHAAGPGHGKAVISSYMIANETQLKRGILISFVSALIQGVVAISLVGTAVWIVLHGASITITEATQAMEIASFAMVMLFGAWLLVRKLWSLRIRREPVSIFTTAGDVSAGRGRGSGMDMGLRFQDKPIFTDHDHDGAGGRCMVCEKSHAPDPLLLESKNFSLHEAWSAIIAVGLRPCSGAIIVMSFALLNGLYLGGVLSVLAMSLGTAIMVSLLAIIAVSAKGLAVHFASLSSRKAADISYAIEIAGALFVLLIGLMLLGASLQF